jgi:HSP20 family protein
MPELHFAQTAMPIDDWQREMERYLAHFARTGKRPTIVFTQHPHAAPVWTPAVDMYETEDALVVVLELAGVDAQQTDVKAEPHALTIRGVRRQRVAQDNRTYHALEMAYGRFERTVRLPPGLDTDAAQASYKDGLLEITLPKRSPHQVRIDVEGGAQEPAR